MDFMFDWEEGDRLSFEDSDRFEEDSLCSWASEPESLCNNWRGWRKNGGAGYFSSGKGGDYHFCQILTVVIVFSETPFANIHHTLTIQPFFGMLGQDSKVSYKYYADVSTGG